MESPGCSSGSIRLSYGAPASPMHLAFYVTASPSTLPSSSPSLEANLHSSPATGTRWQRHCRQRTWRTLPQTARFDRGSSSCAYKGRSCWLHSRTRTPGRSCWLHFQTPTPKHDNEHGICGGNRGGAEDWQLGPTSRTSDDASLASAFFVVVS